MQYPDTYYSEDIGPVPMRDQLNDNIDADICVIGAGLAGLTTALELLRGGKSVVVLEAARVGWGASGRNGGSVLEGFSQSHENIVKSVGAKDAAKLHQLSRDGVDYIRRQISELEIPDAIEGNGRYSVVRHGDSSAAKNQVMAANARNEKAVKYLDNAATREILDTDKYNHSVYDPNGFHIQPLRYVLGLAKAIEDLGGRIFEGSKATGLRRGNAGWQAKTANGSVNVSQIVLCTSAYDFSLFPKVSRAMLPIATYVTATKPMAGQLDKVIKTKAAISDTRRAGDYYRRLKNGRLLWGGRITARKSQPADLPDMLRSDILSVYPQLSGLEISHTWMGLMGYSPHKMPLIGEIKKGVWMATAFGGHGLNTTAMAGCLIASAITNGDQRYKLFDIFKPYWAGGVLGRVAVQITYWLMLWQDRSDERRLKS